MNGKPVSDRISIAQCLVVTASLALALAGCGTGPLPPIPPFPDDLTELPAVEEQFRESYTNLRNEPELHGHNGRLGMLFHVYGRPDEAATMYERWLIIQNSDVGLYYRGLVLAQAGQVDLAVETLRGGMEQGYFDYPAAHWELAQLLYDNERLDESIEVCRAALARFERSAELHFGLGRALLANGDAEGAVEPLRMSIRLAGPFGEGYSTLAQAFEETDNGRDAEFLRELAQTYESRTLAIPDRMLSRVEALSRDPEVAIARAEDQIKRGRLQSAVPYLNQALGGDPGNITAHSQLVLIYGTLKQFEKAEEHYKSALESGSEIPNLYLHMGMVRLGQEQPDEAIRMFRRAIERDPAFSDAYLAWGRALEQQGQLAAAEARYREALDRHPEHRASRFAIAALLERADRLGEAAGHFEKALLPIDALTPKVSRALAKYYRTVNNSDKAIEALRLGERAAEWTRETAEKVLIQRNLRDLGAEPEYE